MFATLGTVAGTRFGGNLTADLAKTYMAQSTRRQRGYRNACGSMHGDYVGLCT